MITDREFKAKWVAALRSDIYEQGTGSLFPGDVAGTKYCCLGVAAVVLGGSRIDENVADEWQEQYGYTKLNNMGVPTSTLWHMNDAERRDFNYIADYIEREL